MRRFSTTLAIALSLLLLVSISSAQQTSTTSVPNLIRYSGTLKDAHGAAISSAEVGVTFTLYKQQDGGAAVWLETQNVTPDSNGQYNVVLGSTTAKGLPTDLFSQQEERWLGVQVQGQAEQPRVLLVSVPYAFKAYEAETLGGLPASAFVKAATPDASTIISTDTGSSQSAGTAVNAANTAASGKTKAPPQPLSQTQNRIPVFADNMGTLKDSMMRQTASSVLADGNFDLTNATKFYGIGGNKVLSILGTSNLFVGASAGFVNSSGANNTFVGTNGGFNNTSGSGNSFFGAFAGTSNTTGFNNTFAGFNAGIGNTVGSANAFYGSGAGYHNSSGSNNTFLGQNAGATNTIGGSNTFTGDDAGYNNTAGQYNTFSGTSAGASNTTGNENSFFGFYSGYLNTKGNYNTFVGRSAGTGNTTGGANTFAGWSAGGANATGRSNTFFGYLAGARSNADRNTFYGYMAGSNNKTGTFDLYIDNQGPAAGTESNTIRIGDPVNHTATYINGIYGNKNSNLSPVLIDSNGRLWQGVTQPGVVTSFNGRTGAVVSQTGDYSFSLLSGTLLDGQLPATYNSQITLANPLNVYYGDGSHLTGVQHQSVIKGQQQQIDSQQQQIEQLQQRLSQLEAVVAQLTQAAAQK